MNLLFIGDVVGKPGRRVISEQLPLLRNRHKVDLVVANAENIADGAGITQKTAEELFAAGVDVMTNGNHAWDKKEALEYITTEPRLLRPHNYPEGTPGTGWFVISVATGHRVGILNLMGNVYMHPTLACPFAAADTALAAKPEDVKMVLVDLHAEVTSEKMAMSWFLDGRVSAVVGTHTHVPTADDRILPKGTAYQSDIGMTGPLWSVIGFAPHTVLPRFLNGLPTRFEVGDGPVILNAVQVDIESSTGRAVAIERVQRVWEP
jgi:metallophosphoesterase (TIGR00282 family)